MAFWLAFRRRRPSQHAREADLDREVNGHLDLEAEEQAASGISLDEARTAAYRAFGNVALIKEDTRSVWTRRSADWFLQDLHYALRLMRRTPGWTTIAVLSLALGIGASAAVFSVIDVLVLRPLPVSDPGSLVSPMVHLGTTGTSASPYWNYSDFVLARDSLWSKSGVTAIADVERSHVVQDDGTILDAIHIALVSGTYFPMLGVRAAVGRTLTEADDRIPGGHPVAVVSDEFWRRQMGRSRDAVGQTLKVNNTSYTILGIMPEGFSGDWVGHPESVWIPIAMQSEVMTERPGLLQRRGPAWVRILARLEPGSSVARVEGAANALYSPSGALSSAILPRSGPDARRLIGPRVVLASATHGFSSERRDLALPVTIVTAIVGIVLLIACANVANLLLVRATGRRSEAHIRVALGAGRRRLLFQSLVEGGLLAALAGVVGVAVAEAGLRILERVIASGPTAFTLDLNMNVRSLLLAVGVSSATAIIFGLAPLTHMWRQAVAPTLRSRGRRESVICGRFRFLQGLVVLQVALALILLVGAALFIRTLTNLKGLDLGVDRNRVVLVQFAPGQAGLEGAAIANLMARLPDRVASIYGVTSVAASSFAMLGGVGNGSRCTVTGFTYGPDDDNFVWTNRVTPGFFDAMGVSVSLGRDISSGDNAARPRVAVVNETMARYYWGTVNVVGRRFGLGQDRGDEIEVVGVVNDARTEMLREGGQRTVFLPYQQDVSHLRSLTLAVHVSGSAATFRKIIRDQLRLIAPTLPVVSVHTVDDNVDQLLLTERLVALLAGLFGVVALGLTCLGLYGVMSYVTARRTNEIGVRIAMGAGPRNIVRLVIGECLSLVLLGVAIGVPFALWGMHMAQAGLFGVSAADLPTVATATVVMFAVAMTAGYLPARRATHVEPAIALRFD